MTSTIHDVARRIGAIAGIPRVLAVDSVDSTNDAMRRYVDAGSVATGTVLVADAQTAGRGRHGRTWHSASGLGLYLSWLVRPSGPVELLPRWTLLAAVAACAACREAAGTGIEVKWPNDVVAGGRKLGGVLADLRTSGGASELILGVGLNVGHREHDLPPELRSRATSLALVAGDIMDRAEVAAGVVAELLALGERLQRGDWDVVRARWTALAAGTPSGRVRVVDRRSAGGAWTGTVLGLDARGALRVRREPDGGEVAVHDGESVVPIEGR